MSSIVGFTLVTFAYFAVSHLALCNIAYDRDFEEGTPTPNLFLITMRCIDLAFILGIVNEWQELIATYPI